MNYSLVFLGIILVGLMALVIFLLGAFFMRHIMEQAYEDARYAQKVEECYRLAGYQKPGDPKPYVAPQPRTPRNTVLPGMGALDRLMKAGKRGTVMWRAGDRPK